jgi:tRNA (guanine-N7-)-methyltransferase
MRAPSPYERAPRVSGPKASATPAADAAEKVLLDDLLAVKSGPLEIEIGPGRGNFLYERLAVRSDVRMIGLEIRRKWATLVDDRLKARGLGDRARVFSEDAREVLPRLSPSGAVSAFFVHFPDPWWKKRHQKRMVVGDVLVREIIRLLVTGGELYVQTDVEERAAQYEDEIGLFAELLPAGDREGTARLEQNPYGARSNREKRADEDGLPVHRMRWRRK